MPIALFASTLFLGSFLMFLVEPMVAKAVLPLFGGAPAVWSTSVVFFQLTLVAGYAYAHAGPRWLGVRRHAFVHLLLVGASVLALPIAVRAPASAPIGHPAPALLALLSGAVGIPFLALSAGAPLLQKWLAVSSHPAARDPYFLYAASNAGSLAALLAYPLLIEPIVSLRGQERIVAGAYVVWVASTALCAAVARPASRADDRVAVDSAPARASAAPVDWTRRGHWVLLSAVPASLMLGVTAYVSTDLAAVPLLWIVPLAVYLLTFIVAFGSAATRARAAAGRAMPLVVLPLALMMAGRAAGPFWFLVSLHLLAFGVLAFLCHSRLALERPPAAELTEFYFWVALGGMAGGVFNTLVAPLLFSNVLEYPVMLLAACALGFAETGPGPSIRPGRRAVAVPLAVSLWTAAVLAGAGWLGLHARMLMVPLAPAALLSFLVSRARLPFAACVGTLLLAGSVPYDDGRGPVLETERTFFGVYRVRADPEGYRLLFHGTTLHGMQSTSTERRREPLTYYHPTGPFGQLLGALPQLTSTPEVAVVGLGTGSLAAYGLAGQRWTFYEIDPAVERIARTAAYFTYLDDCGSRCRVVPGDARLSLAGARDGQYGLMVLDAFSSDAIPIHLVTREALSLYLAKLAPGGVLAFHISNRHLALGPILGRLGDAHGLSVLGQFDARTPRGWPPGKTPAEWVVMARMAAELAPLARDRRWATPRVTATTPLWTDQFSNVLAAVTMR